MTTDAPQKRDFIEKYAPHACCIGVIFSAAVFIGIGYMIYWLIMALI